jgi:hypothetical protein
LNAKVDTEVDSLHVKRIGIEDLVGYVYIVRVDIFFTIYNHNIVFHTTIAQIKT